MKTSNKLLLSTFIVLFATIFGVILYTRLLIDSELNKIDYGETIEKHFNFDDYTEIEISGKTAWNVMITQADNYKCSIKCPELILETLKIEKKDKLLHFHLNKSTITLKNIIELKISQPALSLINTTSNRGLIEFSNFRSEKLTIRSTGRVKIIGRNNEIMNLKINETGLSTINLKDSHIKNAHIIITGKSTVELTMTGEDLTGDISGWGNIIYYGEVNKVRLNKSGIGSIKRKK